jgi:type I restriction enzyme S subunit
MDAPGAGTLAAVEEAIPTALISSALLNAGEQRLDAAYYNPETMQAHIAMEASGLKLKRLGDVTEDIFIPPRFKRVYVDAAYGVPFLQGSHLVHFRPTDLKYLSRSAHKNLEQWIISAGWVLVTCSGTIGRVAIALQQWDGWAASQHILRVVPKPDGSCPAGYIYAWLSSPLGQAQFNGIYGAVVDELTDAHVANIRIPVPETGEQREVVSAINAMALDAIALKEQALKQDVLAVDRVARLIPTTES